MSQCYKGQALQNLMNMRFMFQHVLHVGALTWYKIPMLNVLVVVHFCSSTENINAGKLLLSTYTI